MKLLTIVYVTDMDASIRFYGWLGFAVRHRSPYWTELDAGDRATLALHLTNDPPQAGNQVEVATVADRPLFDIEAAARDEGLPIAGPITAEIFGRSLRLRDPDGLIVQVNEYAETSDRG